jgi:hypothetical protein
MAEREDGQLQAVKRDLLAAIRESKEQLREELGSAIRQSRQELREELTAALVEHRLELTAELRREVGSVRSEISGLRKAVEIVAVKLLTEPEVQEVRRAAAV